MQNIKGKSLWWWLAWIIILIIVVNYAKNSFGGSLKGEWESAEGGGGICFRSNGVGYLWADWDGSQTPFGYETKLGGKLILTAQGPYQSYTFNATYKISGDRLTIYMNGEEGLFYRK